MSKEERKNRDKDKEVAGIDYIYCLIKIKETEITKEFKNVYQYSKHTLIFA